MTSTSPIPFCVAEERADLPDPFEGIDPTTDEGQRLIRQITDARLRELTYAKARKDREHRERERERKP